LFLLAFLICKSQILLSFWRTGHLLANCCSTWVVLNNRRVVDGEASRVSVVATVLVAGSVIGKAMEVELLAGIAVMDIDVTAVEIVY
jgi:hypothetical protein